MPRSPLPEPAASSTWPKVASLRLERHHVVERVAADRLVDVVRELLGVQAQVTSSAELQLAARVDGLRRADVREALRERRELVKTWAMRGTLHWLAADDLAGYVEAAATHDRWHTPIVLRFLGLTAAELDEIVGAIAAELSATPRTRTALAEAVAEHVDNPVFAKRIRSGWGELLKPVARIGRLAYGPDDGRSVTFVRPSAWLGRGVPNPERPAAEPLDALAGLLHRWLAAFPGASRDMAARWWGAHRVTLLGDAAARLGEAITVVDVAGTRAWVRAEDVIALEATRPLEPDVVRLLPGFDPYVNELPRKTASLLAVERHADVNRTAGWVSAVVLAGPRIVGVWEQPTVGSPEIAVTPFERWPAATKRGVQLELERYAAFLDRPLRASFGRPIG